MHVNGLPIRYVGTIHAANYSTYTHEFLNLQHAVEHLQDLYTSTAGDSILLFRTDAHESRGEAYSRTEDTVNATHVLTLGPRGGVRVERV